MALKMLKTALEMEQKGFEFYRRASDTCRNEAARELFRTLQMDEVVHMKRIRDLFSSLEGGGSWNEDWQKHAIAHPALANVFRDLARRSRDHIRADSADLEAVEVGIEFEARSVRFYEDRLAEAEDPIERRFLQAMVEEERTHHQALQDTRLYLTDPSAWFAANERGHADGG